VHSEWIGVQLQALHVVSLHSCAPHNNIAASVPKWPTCRDSLAKFNNVSKHKLACFSELFTNVCIVKAYIPEQDPIGNLQGMRILTRLGLGFN
jgi:hypothetical protein